MPNTQQQQQQTISLPQVLVASRQLQDASVPLGQTEPQALGELPLVANLKICHVFVKKKGFSALWLSDFSRKTCMHKAQLKSFLVHSLTLPVALAK